MSEWHIARNGAQEGPYTAEQIGAKLAAGELKAGEALAWKEGMDDWKPLADSGVLAEASLSQTPAGGGVPTPSAVANPSPAPAQVAQPAQGSALNPYATPTTAGGLSTNYQNPMEYPGIGRLAYVGLQIAISIGCYALLFLMILGSSSTDGMSFAFGGLMFIILIVGIASIYLGVKRLHNLGMSGWAILWSFVPIMSIWISWRMFACPAGYNDHKQLDTPGKVLTGILVAFILLGFVANIVAAFGGSSSSY
ncbi:MAG: GYF domain-containing protein [Verrucomicrobiota bacterium]